MKVKYKKPTVYERMVERHRPHFRFIFLPSTCKNCSSVFYMEKGWVFTEYYFGGFEDPHCPSKNYFCNECCEKEEDVLARLFDTTPDSILKLKHEYYD